LSNKELREISAKEKEGGNVGVLMQWQIDKKQKEFMN
jgi:dsRNA-specific ribonuclease